MLPEIFTHVIDIYYNVLYKIKNMVYFRAQILIFN